MRVWMSIADRCWMQECLLRLDKAGRICKITIRNIRFNGQPTLPPFLSSYVDSAGEDKVGGLGVRETAMEILKGLLKVM